MAYGLSIKRNSYSFLLTENNPNYCVVWRGTIPGTIGVHWVPNPGGSMNVSGAVLLAPGVSITTLGPDESYQNYGFVVQTAIGDPLPATVEVAVLSEKPPALVGGYGLVAYAADGESVIIDTRREQMTMGAALTYADAGGGGAALVSPTEGVSIYAASPEWVLLSPTPFTGWMTSGGSNPYPIHPYKEWLMHYTDNSGNPTYVARSIHVFSWVMGTRSTPSFSLYRPQWSTRLLNLVTQ